MVPHSILWGVSELFSGNHQVVGIIKVIASLIFSPLLGFTIAYLIQKISALMLRNSKFSINHTINKLQWIVAAALAFSHGSNDSQKITGLISLALISAGVVKTHSVPLSIKIAVGLVMFVGTALGGWKIMKTIGNKIYDLRPIHSLNSMLSSGILHFDCHLYWCPSFHNTCGSRRHNGCGCSRRISDGKLEHR